MSTMRRLKTRLPGHLPAFLPMGWRDRYLVWRWIDRNRPLTPEQLEYGAQLWEEIKARRDRQ